jgi:hypothetical protein
MTADACDGAASVEVNALPRAGTGLERGGDMSGEDLVRALDGLCAASVADFLGAIRGSACIHSEREDLPAEGNCLFPAGYIDFALLIGE